MNFILEEEQFEVQWLGPIQAGQWWEEGVLWIQPSHYGPAVRTSWVEKICNQEWVEMENTIC